MWCARSALQLPAGPSERKTAAKGWVGHLLAVGDVVDVGVQEVTGQLQQVRLPRVGRAQHVQGLLQRVHRQDALQRLVAQGGLDGVPARPERGSGCRLAGRLRWACAAPARPDKQGAHESASFRPPVPQVPWPACRPADACACMRRVDAPEQQCRACLRKAAALKSRPSQASAQPAMPMAASASAGACCTSCASTLGTLPSAAGSSLS